MAAVLVEVSEAITDLLNDAAFATFITALAITDEWEAEFSYAEWDLALDSDEASDLLIDVVPSGHSRTELDAVGSLKYVTDIDVAVRKKFGNADRAESGRVDIEEINRLVWLVEMIHEYFLKDRPEDYPNAVWTGASIRVACDRKMLRENRQFLGIVRLTFETSKAIA